MFRINASNSELEQWKRSFDILMSTTRGQDSFRHFLRSEYSEENMMFWLSCEELKELRDNSHITEKCKQIYEEYISVLSPKEVSIDSRIREIINRNMVNPDTKTFEEAQNQIYQLMKRDSYHRFINSPFFKSLEQNAKNCPSPPPSAQSQPPTSQHTPASLSGASSGGHPGTTPGSSASSNSNNTKNNSSSSNRSPLSAQNNSAAGGGDPHKGSNLGRTTTTTTGEDSGGSSVNSSKPTANSNSGK